MNSEDNRYDCYYLNLVWYYSEDKIYDCYYLNMLSYYFEDNKYDCYYLNMFWYYSREKYEREDISQKSIDRGWSPKIR